MTKKYKEVTTLSKALRILAEQDRMIGELTRRNNSLEDIEGKRGQWLQKAKDEAGADRRESFDSMWARTLQKAQLYDKEKKL